jgi:Fic family protein
MEARLFELDAKTESLRAKIGSFPEKLRTDYESKLDVSWIFHDNALEGVVLSYSELKAAIDQRIISDVSLIPMYYAMVTPDAVAKGCPYRKENPLHRLYYHEITPPEKIPYKMRKLAEWLESSEFAGLHTIVKGVKIQLRLLQAYPWTQNSGKVARLLTNYLLLQNGYLPAVVHSIDRQRYYEVLRHENDGLMTLILESLENSIDTTSRFFDELSGLRVRCAS